MTEEERHTRFTPLLVEAARPCRHAVGDRWQVDETYLKLSGTWRYLYRAIDQFGQVVDVLLSTKRDARAARRFLRKAIGGTRTEPAEVVTDRAPAYGGVLDELLPAAFHNVEQYVNNVLEVDHGRLKSRLGPTRGLKTQASAQLFSSGRAFVQNLRRGHYELAVAVPPKRRSARPSPSWPPCSDRSGVQPVSNSPVRPNATAPFKAPGSRSGLEQEFPPERAADRTLREI